MSCSSYPQPALQVLALPLPLPTPRVQVLLADQNQPLLHSLLQYVSVLALLQTLASDAQPQPLLLTLDAPAQPRILLAIFQLQLPFQLEGVQQQPQPLPARPIALILPLADAILPQVGGRAVRYQWSEYLFQEGPSTFCFRCCLMNCYCWKNYFSLSFCLPSRRE